ncbi:MAG: hypothetical protein ACOYW9_15080 [Deinococcota bacterium]
MGARVGAGLWGRRGRLDEERRGGHDETEHLERLLDSLGRYGQTHTALVVSAVLEGPTLPPPGD